MLEPEKGDGIIFGASSVDQVAPIITDSYVYDRAHTSLAFGHSGYFREKDALPEAVVSAVDDAWNKVKSFAEPYYTVFGSYLPV
jgi:hypothetical protein